VPPLEFTKLHNELFFTVFETLQSLELEAAKILPSNRLPLYCLENQKIPYDGGSP
jgi:hypothetical protein